jgi:hypothetical protein
MAKTVAESSPPLTNTTAFLTPDMNVTLLSEKLARAKHARSRVSAQTAGRIFP